MGRDEAYEIDHHVRRIRVGHREGKTLLAVDAQRVDKQIEAEQRSHNRVDGPVETVPQQDETRVLAPQFEGFEQVRHREDGEQHGGNTQEESAGSIRHQLRSVERGRGQERQDMATG